MTLRELPWRPAASLNPRARAGLVVAAAAAAALGAGGPLLVPEDQSVALICLIGLLLAAPVCYWLLTGSFDVLHPLAWAIVALAMMFLIRPAAHIYYDQFTHREQFDISSTFDRALIGAVVGIAGMYAGYALPLGRGIARRVAALPDDTHDESVTAWAVILAVLGVLGYALYARSAGISPLSIISGGIQGGGQSSAYLYMAPFVIIPASLLLMRTGLRTRLRVLVPVAVLVLVVEAYSLAPAGQRLWLLLLTASFATYPMLRSGWRPPLLALPVLAVVAFFGVVAMRDLSFNQGSRPLVESFKQSWSEPEKAWKELITGPDTEMFSGLAVGMQAVPSQVPFDRGSAVLTLISHPIPRSLWPSKPHPTDETLDAMLLPGVALGDASMAHSVMGSFYYDSGYPGIFLGMLAIGVGIRWLWEYRKQNDGNDTVALFYATCLPIVIVLLRGNLPDTFARALFTSAPIILVALLARRRLPGDGARAA
jgi:hypothetical protein